MSKIHYTHHARAKFALLQRYGFEITMDQVTETVLNPDKVFLQSGGRYIQGVCKVRFKDLSGLGDLTGLSVITFYPGRRERYETEL